jgi:hypothetical protein
VNHCRRIISSTSGHPARWNDKTLVLYNDFACGVHEGKCLSEFEFVLLERDSTGNIVERKYKGVRQLVDNGYFLWLTTIPPFKTTVNQRETRWLQWVESMRKDVECTFGILKGRWRILKVGVHLSSAIAMDRVWFTCCALHNWLLEEDSLNKNWESGVQSEWEGELVELGDDVERVHNAVQNLSSNLSGFATGNEDDDTEEDLHQQETMPADSTLNDGTRIVHLLSQKFFHQRLVKHFDILWQNNELVWPKHTGNPIHGQS